MGAYATTAELIARFASSTEAAYATDAELVGIPSETVLAECIGSAEGEINSYVAQRYLTPLRSADLADTSVAELFRGVTLDMAEYHVLNRGPEPSEQKVAQYERRLAWLKLIAEGKVQIPGAATVPSTASRNPLAAWSGSDRDLTDVPTRIFSRETMGAL